VTQVDEEESDQEFLVRVEQANTPREILALIVENQNLLGFDPYYADLRKAVLDRVSCVLALTTPNLRGSTAAWELAGEGFGVEEIVATTGRHEAVVKAIVKRRKS